MQLIDFKKLSSSAGVMGRIFNHLLIPLYSAVAPVKDESHLEEEIAGIASGLGFRAEIYCLLFYKRDGRTRTETVSSKSGLADILIRCGIACLTSFRNRNFCTCPGTIIR